MNHESWIYPRSSRPFSQRCHVDVDLWTSRHRKASPHPRSLKLRRIRTPSMWKSNGFASSAMSHAQSLENPLKHFFKKSRFWIYFMKFGVFIKQPTIRCCPPRSCLWALSHLTWKVDELIRKQIQRRVARAKHGFCHLLKVIWRDDLRATAAQHMNRPPKLTDQGRL